MSDKELLEAIALKEESAFNTFYDRYEQLLYKWAYNRTGDINLTNEITQNFWINVWSEPALIKTDNMGSARNFLLHHYTYRMLNYLKSSYSKIIGGENRDSIEEIEDTLLYTHIEEEFDFQEINSIINKILKQLPEIDREVMMLLWQEDLSVKETSRYLKIDERTVNYKSKRGISLLRKTVENLYNNTDVPKIKTGDSDLLKDIPSSQ